MLFLVSVVCTETFDGFDLAYSVNAEMDTLTCWKGCSLVISLRNRLGSSTTNLCDNNTTSYFKLPKLVVFTEFQASVYESSRPLMYIECWSIESGIAVTVFMPWKDLFLMLFFILVAYLFLQFPSEKVGNLLKFVFNTIQFYYSMKTRVLDTWKNICKSAWVFP